MAHDLQGRMAAPDFEEAAALEITAQGTPSLSRML
jgi:hypothetical protein